MQGRLKFEIVHTPNLELKQKFAEIVGSGGKIHVARAPGRANLIGEHTDYNEGFVFPFAIAQRTAAAVALRHDDVIRVRSTFSPDAVEVSLGELDARIAAGGLDWAGYPLGVAWALLREAPNA